MKVLWIGHMEKSLSIEMATAVGGMESMAVISRMERKEKICPMALREQDAATCLYLHAVLDTSENRRKRFPRKEKRKVI